MRGRLWHEIRLLIAAGALLALPVAFAIATARGGAR